MLRSFHGFEIQEKIGAGGMSTVYRGIHTTLGYPVAIKVLHPGLAGDAHFIARFEREAKAASGLRSVNIATVIDFGSENDIYFIVMEFVDGPDLARVFDTLRDENGAQQPFPAEIALLLLEDVAYGLREAHAQGIIHRDIKPSNVLINSRGEVKLVDFGLARSTRERALLTANPADDLTRPGMIIGTPSYMSPEQAAGKEDIDHRTDIFALGVMAYQIIAGEKPFLGDSPSEVQERILNQTPRPLSETGCPLFAPEMEAMLERMLAKDPGKRFQSMDQVLGALRECMECVDVTGDLAKLRRDYLARFAQDPGANARELRHNAINSHLRLGFHFKNLGLTSIDDAQLEFSRVLRLDPKNQKATRALSELKQQAGQASGTGAPGDVPGKTPRAPDADATAVLPAAGPPAAKSAPVEKPAPKRSARTAPAAQPPVHARARRGFDLKALLTRPWLLGGVAVIIAVAALAGLLGRKSETSSDATATFGAEGDTLTQAVPPSSPADVIEGVLFVETDPSGATVRIRRTGDPNPARVLSGVTPLLESTLAPGSWEVIASLGGRVDQSTLAEITAGQRTALSLTLPPVTAAATAPADAKKASVPSTSPAQGRLTIKTEPAGARISLRLAGGPWQTVSGASPLTTDALAAGECEIRAELAGHEPATLKLKVVGGQTLPVELTLRPRTATPPAETPTVVTQADADTLGILEFASDVAVSVAIDGQLVASKTPCRADVPPGRHTIELRGGDFLLRGVTMEEASGTRTPVRGIRAIRGNHVFSVTVERGQRVRLVLDLTKKGRG